MHLIRSCVENVPAVAYYRSHQLFQESSKRHYITANTANMTGLSVAHTARSLVLLVLINLRCCDSFRNLGVSNSNTRHDQSGTYCKGRSLHYFHSSLQSSRNTEMISKTQRIRNVKRRLRLPAMYINTLGIFALAWCMKIFTRRWIAIRASEKFCMAGKHQYLRFKRARNDNLSSNVRLIKKSNIIFEYSTP